MNELIPFLPALIRQVATGLHFFLPEAILALFFCTSIVIELIVPGKRSVNTLICSIAGLTLAGLSLLIAEQTNVPAWGATFIFDTGSSFLRLLIFAILIVFLFFVHFSAAMRSHAKGAGDLYILVPALGIGLVLMGMSLSLLMIYLSIEMVSLGSYILVGYTSRDKSETEAATKYVLFGSACSAVMLYGISLLYGFTGTLNVADPAFTAGLSTIPALPLTIGLGFLFVGVGFKLSFVPFHFWTPDVYDGAATPVAAFLSTAPKVAGILLLYRLMPVFSNIEISHHANTHFLLATAAIASMLIGNFVALWQQRVKRMLAYSAIGHTGFVMMAVLSNTKQALPALMFYLLVYAVMNLAAFMLANYVEERTGAVTIDDYRGLGKKFKIEMVAFVVILISLTGLPPLAGFVSKFLVFSAMFDTYSRMHREIDLYLLITGAITTVVALFFYIRIPLNAFLREAITERPVIAANRVLLYIVLLLTATLIVLGICPGVLL